jgi:hypothetical protein
MSRISTILLLLTAIGLAVFVGTTHRWRFSTERVIQPGSALFQFDPEDISGISIKNGDQVDTAPKLQGFLEARYQVNTAFAASLDTLRANLKAIRDRGYAMSVGELDPGLAGIAVPLFRPGDGGTAALGVILSTPRFATTDVDAMVARLRQTADDVTRSIEARAAAAQPRA